MLALIACRSSLMWPSIVMFDDLGDHFVRHGFWCVQILILQHQKNELNDGKWKHMYPTSSKICEMGLCPWGWTLYIKARGFQVTQEEEELRFLSGAGVNKVYVRKTSVAKPQGNGVGCNTTSPFTWSRHYFSNKWSNQLTMGWSV